MKLHSYWRSSTSYRARIALHLKELPFETVPVHLLKEGGQQNSAAFAALNPVRGVPVLEEDGFALGQSLAIIEYLEETHPQPPLLPRDPRLRARHRQLALIVASDVHPLINLKVGQYIRHQFGQDEAALLAWNRHWISAGLQAAEQLLDPAGPYALGDRPGLADLCLVPQVYSALKRFQLDLSACPRLLRVYEACNRLEAFRRAAPENQPDAEVMP